MELEGGSEADIEDAYTAGMLHDIGKLMLADNLPLEFQKASVTAAAQKIPLHQAEQELFSATHAGIAAYLLGLWGLSASIVEAVALHHAPEKSELLEPSPLMAVHVANALAMTKPNGKIPEVTKPLNLDYLAKIGMADRLDAWKQLAAMPPIQRDAD